VSPVRALECHGAPGPDPAGLGAVEVLVGRGGVEIEVAVVAEAVRGSAGTVQNRLAVGSGGAGGAVRASGAGRTLWPWRPGLGLGLLRGVGDLLAGVSGSGADHQDERKDGHQAWRTEAPVVGAEALDEPLRGPLCLGNHLDPSPLS